jgi:hypothetical protein
MTNDEKYTKVAQALQTLRNDLRDTMYNEPIRLIITGIRSIDACNAMLSNVSVDDMVKLYDLITGVD